MYGVLNTGDVASIANAMRYINWFYSDEGADIISWGKEGETYENVDGKRQFIVENEVDNAQTLYGFKTMGTYTRIDPKCIDASISEEQAATTDFIIGQRPMSEWDAFPKELSELPVNELLALYEKEYDKIK